MKRNDPHFHKLNAVHVKILRRAGKKPRTIQYFMYCYETIRMLTELGYLVKKSKDPKNPFDSMVYLSDKGKAYLVQLDKKEAKAGPKNF